MKRFAIVLIASLFIFTLCACGAKQSKYDEATTEIYKQAIGVMNGVISGDIKPDRADEMLRKLSAKIDTSSGELSIRLAASGLTTAASSLSSEYLVAKTDAIGSGIIDMSGVYKTAKEYRAKWAEAVGITEKQAAEIRPSMIAK